MRDAALWRSVEAELVAPLTNQVASDSFEFDMIAQFAGRSLTQRWSKVDKGDSGWGLRRGGWGRLEILVQT